MFAWRVAWPPVKQKKTADRSIDVREKPVAPTLLELPFASEVRWRCGVRVDEAGAKLLNGLREIAQWPDGWPGHPSSIFKLL